MVNILRINKKKDIVLVFIDILVFYFIALFFFLLFTSCKANANIVKVDEDAQLTDEEFIERYLKKHTTQMVLLNVEESYYDPYAELKISLNDSDKTYFLSPNHVDFSKYRTYFFSKSKKNNYFEIYTTNNSILLVKEIHPKLDLLILERNKAFLEGTPKKNKDLQDLDISKKFLQENDQEVTQEFQTINCLNLSEIQNLYKISKKLDIYDDELTSEDRVSSISKEIYKKTSLSSYKLFFFAKDKKKYQSIKAFPHTDKNNIQQYQWYVLNTFKVFNKEKNKLYWYVIDPYLFDKPMMVHEVQQYFNDHSGYQVSSLIANEYAYKFDSKSNTIIYH